MPVLEPKNWKEVQDFLDKPGCNVILMASTTWCGPCKQFFPIFKEVSDELSDKFVAMKVNLDEAPEINDMLGVGSVPTLIYWFEGKEVYRSIGGCNKKDLISYVNRYFCKG